MAMPVFAEAAVEDAKAEARAEVQAELDEALAQVEYWKNYEPYKTTSGKVTRPMMSGKAVAYGGTATAAVGNYILEKGGNAFDA